MHNAAKRSLLQDSLNRNIFTPLSSVNVKVIYFFLRKMVSTINVLWNWKEYLTPQNSFFNIKCDLNSDDTVFGRCLSLLLPVWVKMFICNISL